MKTPTATPRARALAAALREARESRGVGLRELSRLLALSHAMLSFWEKGTRLPTVEDVVSILTALKVTGEQKERTIELARHAHEPNWIATNIPEAPEQLIALTECERTADIITEWSSSLIPGLLQTPEYARAILDSGRLPSEQVEARMIIRLGRQEIFSRRQPPQFTAIVHEGTLRGGIGGPGVMRGQLLHLLARSQTAETSVRIMPGNSGYHPGLNGSFVVYDYSTLPSIVSLEHHRVTSFLYDQPYVSDYKTVATLLYDLALSEQDSLEVISEAAKELE